MGDPGPTDRDLDAMASTMAALSHPTRLRVYLRLVDGLPGGMASGEIAAATGTLATTMSAHLAVLARAGLVHAERRGKTVVYTALTAPAQALGRELGRIAVS